jgi:hypothetical protein
MALTRIRLELARSEGFPEGSTAIGYDLVAPLTPDGHLDAAAWSANKADCTVRHFANAHQERGHLAHNSRGWFFDYKRGQEDDEPLFRLDHHVLKVGEYISVTEHNGKLLTFKIVSAEKV